MTVCTFGEVLLRLSPSENRRHIQASRYEAEWGANVAVSLSQLGVGAGFVSKLPAHAIGDAALGHLRQHWVDVELVQRGGPRLGLDYHELGAPPDRPPSFTTGRANLLCICAQRD